MEALKQENKNSDDTPPVLGSWGKIYSAVLFILLLLIIIFYFFTRAFE